uniref:Uncharacterized protein n=1 Tax=Chromera velia CCMP2878 TaxID=1169474 RepID=A0A0G4HZS8_9ALVE|eukprot:Cvel_9774.t1-p1 / transcript=Cvel_9774.t1 / gene=Cvel_9774 / organism=Chromera_velia_CCMP2878 / gene_product=BBSome-interacting protein 1, putative / transcript_product=BBSome-interacting protein 1, putative / location=Cvel_scaffold573:23738-25856(+) / protein_length=82 / sequence_SO=supercontig / SO=protein_coding / is_pseudo=false
MGDAQKSQTMDGLREVLPDSGAVYTEKGDFTDVFCKPKIMSIKSGTIAKLESLEQQAVQSSKVREMLAEAQRKTRTGKLVHN